MVKENPDYEYYKTTILSEESFEERIKKESESGSMLSVFFIIHGYIESILLDWFSYCGNGKPDKISEEVLNNIEKMGFSSYLQLHLLMGNISQQFYAKMKKLNYARNNLIHSIRDINLESEKTKKGINKNIKEGINIYKELFKIYEKSLETAGKKFILGSSKLG